MFRNRSLIVLVALVLLAAGATFQAHAQAPTPTVLPGTSPIAAPLMYARVTTTMMKVDKFDEGGVLFRDRVLPALTQMDGFKSIYELGDRKTGKSIVITLWATQAAMMTGESNGAYQQALALFKDYVTAPPTQQDYKVVAQAQAQAPVPASAVSAGQGGATLYAKVTTSTNRLDKMDEGAALMGDSVFPAARQLDGFRGVYALGDRKTGKFLIVTLWATQDAMMAGESNGFYQQQLAKAKDIVAGPPAQQDYEVGLQAHAPVPLTEADKTLVRRYIEQVVVGGHLEVLDELAAPDYKRYLSPTATQLNAEAQRSGWLGSRRHSPVWATRLTI